MELDGVTFVGPAFDGGSVLLDLLPDNLVGLLRQINGFILFDGGLHVRGVCSSPNWHSLESVMTGSGALHANYPALLPSDVPFAQDCVADQFVLRERVVYKLESETGRFESLGLSLPEFLGAVQAEPVEFLGMDPLLRYQAEGASLMPGQVLHVYPPFCTKESAKGVSLKAVPVNEALTFLADFSRRVWALGAGETFRVKVV
ncbi:MAG: hypothetical protein IPK82_34895 [Polyangiaceae bacterium]|nr:hypothetical protein [Polyangiaceae bacterium]